MIVRVDDVPNRQPGNAVYLRHALPRLYFIEPGVNHENSCLADQEGRIGARSIVRDARVEVFPDLFWSSDRESRINEEHERKKQREGEEPTQCAVASGKRWISQGTENVQRFLPFYGERILH